MVVLRYVYSSDNQKSPKNAFNFFKSYTKSFPITRNICHIKLSDLENDRKNHLYIGVYIIVYHKIYNKEKKNYAKLRISGLLLNEYFRISLTKLNSIKHALQTHYMHSTLPHRFNVEYTWCVCGVRGNQSKSRKNQL